MTISLGELAVRYGCELQGDPDVQVASVGTLETAVAGSISFLSNPVYRKYVATTGASAVILQPELAEGVEIPCLLTGDPYLVYARVATELHPAPAVVGGVAATASIDPAATVPDSCQIAAGAVIASGVVLGERVYVGPNCSIGEGSVIGADTRCYANVSIYHNVSIGERCIFHSGVVLGSDGFGNAQSESGWVKVPQVGGLIIGNDVELGANTTVDRGAIDSTRIGNGVRLDNLVQVAHNVTIGDHTAIASQSGISGSTQIGSGCVVGGQSAISGHLSITDGVILAGRSAVSKSINEPGVYASVIPVGEAGKWRRIVARIKRLDDMSKKLQQLEKLVRKDSGQGS